MTVGFLVGSDGKFRDMRRHRAVGQLQHDVLSRRAALFPFFELEIASIGDEISVPNSTRISFALA
jgi:hypothetical protein